MTCYINTYRPLINNRFGKQAQQKHRHPPFADASCRREPDFESEFPSISALCRAHMFAPRLHEGDRVIYLTKKGSGIKGMRHLVAALEVVSRFENHKNASAWYLQRGLPIPSNCLVRGNEPLSIDHTDHHQKNVELWDLSYQLRARKNGTFLVCKSIAKELYDPRAISDNELRSIFGRIPATRTPPAVKNVEFEDLLSFFTKPQLLGCSSSGSIGWP